VGGGGGGGAMVTLVTMAVDWMNRDQNGKVPT
jgi:hypothetical protein